MANGTGSAYHRDLLIDGTKDDDQEASRTPSRRRALFGTPTERRQAPHRGPMERHHHHRPLPEQPIELRAIAEFVENSIDANARNVTIVRGREQGEHYLRVVDDGEGIRLNRDGVPDFDYVATHICDSIKRTLSARVPATTFRASSASAC